MSHDSYAAGRDQDPVPDDDQNTAHYLADKDSHSVTNKGPTIEDRIAPKGPAVTSNPADHMVEVPFRNELELLRILARLIDHVQPFVLTAPLDGAHLWVRPDTYPLIATWMMQESHILEKLREVYRKREEFDAQVRAEKLAARAGDMLNTVSINQLAAQETVTGRSIGVEEPTVRQATEAEIVMNRAPDPDPHAQNRPAVGHELMGEFYCENPDCNFRSYTLGHAVLHTNRIGDVPIIGPHLSTQPNHQIRVRVIE